jgi:flagellar basal body L-ring protein FlgH
MNFENRITSKHVADAQLHYAGWLAKQQSKTRKVK